MFAFLLFDLHPATFFVHKTIVILNLSCPNRISQCDKQLLFRIFCTKCVAQRRFLTLVFKNISAPFAFHIMDLTVLLSFYPRQAS